MIDNKCSKKFPKTFKNHTQVGYDGYPKYKRRSKNNGGCTGNIKIKTCKEPFEVDNRQIIKLFHFTENINFLI